MKIKIDVRQFIWRHYFSPLAVKDHGGMPIDYFLLNYEFTDGELTSMKIEAVGGGCVGLKITATRPELDDLLSPNGVVKISADEVREYARAMFMEPKRCKQLEVSASPEINKMASNDKLLRVMQSLNDSFPDEHYADIEKAAKNVLAALEGDA